MNVLIISTQNPFQTSGIVAYNLFTELNGQGYNTKLLIKSYAKFDSEDIFCMETPIDVFINYWKYKYKILRTKLGFVDAIDKSNPDYHIQDFDQTKQYYSTKKILKKIDFKPDAIFYLFQQNFLTAKNLYELNKITGAKIYWYLMDTAPLTGICHYSWDCKGYIQGCGKCPALYSNDDADQSTINLNYKINYLSKTNIDIVVATEWQKNQVLSSLLFKNKPIHKILLSIDPIIFSFVPKNQAKEKLNISVDKRVIFFGSTAINDRRKGMKYLIESLQIFSDQNKHENILLLIAGNNLTLAGKLPYETRYLGFLANNEELASAFQAADVFLCPSIEDAGPMMINQSIMTGTPVVSFEMGVAFDLVHTGKTGYRAKLKDSIDFSNGINYILGLDSKKFHLMCSNCRDLGLELCSPVRTKKHLEEMLIFNHTVSKSGLSR